MLDRIICFFIGHDWRGPEGKIPQDELNIQLMDDWNRIVCVRCEKDFEPLLFIKGGL